MTDGKFKEVLWHTSLFGSPSYFYQRMSMGLNLAVIYKCNIKLPAK